LTDTPAAQKHLGLALAVISTAQLMVVLDISIVNVALPSIQRALHFTGANLEWVVNAYTLAFGGLLLLGGRLGDLFGKRRMFVIGVGLFSIASLVGGLATDETWLIAARAVQGIGGAIASPTALSLVAATFDEGPGRNRAMGVYAAMSGAGGAIGVLLGGVLTDAFSWRWVLFVNVPIGLAVVLAAPKVLPETERQSGRLDLPGALTATSGMSLLVYGLVHAATTSWGRLGTVLPLAASVVLLGSFIVIELRTQAPLMPLNLFSDRTRSGAYGVMLALGTAVFSMFYFLTLYMQDILGYSALRTGFYYVPFAVSVMVFATVAAKLVVRAGSLRLIMVGTLSAGGGMLWLSFSNQNSTYLGGVIGPMLFIAGGMACCFVPLTLAAVAGVVPQEAGIASALLNSGQQVGGALGLAVLGTVAASLTGDRLHRLGPPASHIPAGAGPAFGSQLPPGLHHAVNHAFVAGYVTAYRVSAALLLVAFTVATLTIRVSAGDAAGAPTIVAA
jgi:EmrB/QacA subfamily drug resistance transporter